MEPSPPSGRRRTPAPSDDPTGGSGLTRRLLVVLPVALLAGLAIGVPLAFWLSEWRVAVAVPLAAAALAGTLAAAVEDGRVQRRVNRTRPDRAADGGPPRPGDGPPP